MTGQKKLSKMLLRIKEKSLKIKNNYKKIINLQINAVRTT